jgi:hypothetical protein
VSRQGLAELAARGYDTKKNEHYLRRYESFPRTAAGTGHTPAGARGASPRITDALARLVRAWDRGESPQRSCSPRRSHGEDRLFQGDQNDAP